MIESMNIQKRKYILSNHFNVFEWKEKHYNFINLVDIYLYVIYYLADNFKIIHMPIYNIILCVDIQVC